MSTARTRRVDTPAELAALMGHDWLFSEEQFAAITAPLEPAVVIAGAGSGKTEVMAARVVWLVATGQVEPGEVLGLTFTTKATAELQQRVTAKLRGAGLLPEPGARPVAQTDDEDELEEPTVATYHSYAANLLTEHGLRIGHEPDTRLLADASRYQLAARVVQRHTAPVLHETDHPPLIVQRLLAIDAELSEHLVSPARLRRYDAEERRHFDAEAVPLRAAKAQGKRVTGLNAVEKAILAIDKRAELLDLVEAYRRLKTQLGLMDFSDQIASAARLAQSQPEVGAIERAKFRVVLLDEYQDTSVAQAQMLSRIFGECHPVTAVGDPNQAIYGWRGASVSNILEFGRDFPGPGGTARSYALTVNRRSDHRILEVANQLAAELYEGRESERLRAKPDAATGEVRAIVHHTSDDELAWLAEEVIAAHRAMREPAWKEIGVLTRDNSQAAAVFDALTGREVPVEIVGLKGLLRLPEVAEVVATLQLVHDVTANAAMLTLLTGPRWAIGPRDLALLGARSRQLAGAATGGEKYADVREQLAAAVEGADPTEISSLCDALEDPGESDYSEDARERFALLAAELRGLRRGAGEPILDLVRRIIDVTGIDIELAASVSPAAAARRDNLDLFVQAVAEFQAVDGQVTLPALLAWLEAEDEFGQGLDVATPSEADSVKLLTVHRAKGLEWDVVFLAGVAHEKFPTKQGRSSWLTVGHVLPAELRGDAVDLPQLDGYTGKDISDLAKRRKENERIEELRLAYVAWTRARERLFVSGYCWAPGRKTGLGPSDYLEATRLAMLSWGGKPDRWAERPDKEDPNPYADHEVVLPWPISHHTPEVERRHEAARWVRAVDENADTTGAEPIEDALVLDRIQQWDDEIGRLIEEVERERSPQVEVPLPSHLSATALARLRDDPAAFAAEMARPMPRRPSPAARFGTRFHAWVESRFGQQDLFDPDELPGRADAGIEDDSDLEEVIAAFERGPFAHRAPHRVEAPFALVLGGQVVRGRIDAVYTEPTHGGGEGYLLVDWKTNQHATADPLQLAIYRVAWAELTGVPPESVRAGFFYVRSGELVEPPDLPGRAELEKLVGAD